MPLPASPQSTVPEVCAAVQPSVPLWKSSLSNEAHAGFALRMSPSGSPLPSPPGAPRSTVVAPKLEKPERAPVLVTAATQTRFAFGSVQGVVGVASLLLLSFPAAATTTALF